MKTVSYSYTRQNLSSLLDQISNNSEIFCISRKNGQEFVVIDKDEYESMAETAYLLRSPKNAEELFKAMDESSQNIGTKIEF